MTKFSIILELRIALQSADGKIKTNGFRYEFYYGMINGINLIKTRVKNFQTGIKCLKL